MILARFHQHFSIKMRTRRRRRVFVEQLEDRSLPSSRSLLADLAPYLPQQQLLNQGGFLTGPTAGSAADIARNYLAAHASELGLTAPELDSAAVTRNYVSNLTGTTHLTFQQTMHGLAVANANFTVNVSARGEIINVGGGL